MRTGSKYKAEQNGYKFKFRVPLCNIALDVMYQPIFSISYTCDPKSGRQGERNLSPPGNALLEK
jgi:hypothetical protein